MKQPFKTYKSQISTGCPKAFNNAHMTRLYGNMYKAQKIKENFYDFDFKSNFLLNDVKENQIQAFYFAF